MGFPSAGYPAADREYHKKASSSCWCSRQRFQKADSNRRRGRCLLELGLSDWISISISENTGVSISLLSM
jgi:hypothetical protein